MREMCDNLTSSLIKWMSAFDMVKKCDHQTMQFLEHDKNPTQNDDVYSSTCQLCCVIKDTQRYMFQGNILLYIVQRPIKLV